MSKPCTYCEGTGTDKYNGDKCYHCNGTSLSPEITKESVHPEDLQLAKKEIEAVLEKHNLQFLLKQRTDKIGNKDKFLSRNVSTITIGRNKSDLAPMHEINDMIELLEIRI